MTGWQQGSLCPGWRERSTLPDVRQMRGGDGGRGRSLADEQGRSKGRRHKTGRWPAGTGTQARDALVVPVAATPVAVTPPRLAGSVFSSASSLPASLLLRPGPCLPPPLPHSRIPPVRAAAGAATALFSPPPPKPRSHSARTDNWLPPREIGRLGGAGHTKEGGQGMGCGGARRERMTLGHKAESPSNADAACCCCCRSGGGAGLR